MKTFKKIILDDLKAQGLGHIAAKITSIRYRAFAGGDSVDVSAVNLVKAEREKLEGILREYQYGKFDGMQDLYEYDREPATKSRQAKFVSLSHEWTQDMKERIKVTLAKDWDITDDQSAMARMGCWYDQASHRLLSQLEAL